MRHIVYTPLLICLLASTALAQMQPLPPVSSDESAFNVWPSQSNYQPGEQPVFQPVSAPVYPTNIFPPPTILPDEARSASQGRDGVLQRVTFVGTYLPRFDDVDGQGIVDVELSATLGFPFPTRDSPLLVTPAFDTHFWEGPTGADLPPVVYDAYVDFRWLRKLNDYWGIDLSVTPGLHTDFQASDGDALRIKARAVTAYDWTPQAKVVLGILFLDREDVPFLPIGGLIWTPNDATRWELVFPRPKLAQRFSCDGCVENWWYVAGELGGDQWAFERPSGLHDVVTTRDLRVMLGIEQKITGGLQSWYEIGYVFNREIEFESRADVEPSATLMLRAGLAY